MAFSLCNTWAFANGSGKLYPFRCNISTATKGVATNVGRFFHRGSGVFDRFEPLNFLALDQTQPSLLVFISGFVHEQITKHQQSKK